MSQLGAEAQANEHMASFGELSTKLDRVLDAVETQQRQGSLELLLVFVLSLTALGSTWCAYQSQLWNGAQLVHLADAEVANQKAEGATLIAMQRRTMDGLVVLHVMNALHQGDAASLEAMRRRAQSPLREALDACLALDPIRNPDVPGPLRMPQYVLVEEQNAEQERASAREHRAAAQRAGNNGDTYVLLTLVFASVLFFGGITGTFKSRRLRLGLAGIASVLFLGTVIRLTTMPVCGA